MVKLDVLTLVLYVPSWMNEKRQDAALAAVDKANFPKVATKAIQKELDRIIALRGLVVEVGH